MARIIGFDFLRALAISLVVLSHMSKDFYLAGFYGVELFFALSGFLIGSIFYRVFVEAPRFSFRVIKIFLLRRWWRTMPNYYLFLIINIWFFSHSGGNLSDLNILPYLIFSQSVGDLAQFYNESWSLCVEEWFYLLLPLSFFLFNKLGLTKKYTFLVVTIAFIVIPIFLREFSLAYQPTVLLRTLTFGRLDSIFYGVAIAFIACHYQLSSSVKRLLGFSSLAVLLVFILFQHFYYSDTTLALYYRVSLIVLPLSFAMALPWFSMFHKFPAMFNSLQKPIFLVSIWSYSIYLSHIPILFLTYQAFGLLRSSTFINLVSKLAALSICLLISSLLFKYFEFPLTRLRPAESSAH